MNFRANFLNLQVENFHRMIQSILQSSGTRRSWEHRSSSNIIFLTASCGISTRRDVIKRLNAYYKTITYFFLHEWTWKTSSKELEQLWMVGNYYAAVYHSFLPIYTTEQRTIFTEFMQSTFSKFYCIWLHPLYYIMSLRCYLINCCLFVLILILTIIYNTIY